MTNTKRNVVDFEVEDFMKLMLFCKRNSVLRLKLGLFEVEFKDSVQETRALRKNKVKSKEHEQNNDTALLEQEAEAKNRQVDEALIIDPALAESLILEGKLEDG